MKRARPVKVLSDEQLDAIHEASLTLLEKTGVRFDSADARKRLVAAGCVSHRERKDVVTFPRSIVLEAISKVESHPAYFARDSAWDVRFDGERVFPYAGGGDPKLVDLDSGIPRPATYEDVEAAARIGDALPNCNFASGVVVPNDVPPEMIALKTAEAMVKNSVKCITGYAPDPKSVDFLVKMFECISGGSEEFRRRPLISLSGSPSSPLTYSEHVADVLIRSLELGVPYTVVPCPIAGETGPITLSGSLALQNAEVLAGVVLMQAVDGTLATQYAGRLCFMDPRSGRDLWALPEEGLACVAMVQLAGKYGMCSDACGMTSEIPSWGFQMGLERMMTILCPVLGGAESVSGIGGGWEGASCLEMMPVDSEILNDVARFLEGIEVDSDRLALDILDRLGPMGNFLAQPHTMTYLRKGELRVSNLWDKRLAERRVKEGVKDLRDEAKERARRILKEHVPEPLDRDVVRDMDEVLRQAAKVLVR